MSMTMADRAKISNELSRIRQKIAGYSTQKGRMNEATTIRLLIEPALDALGWDTDDPSQVCREYTTSGKGKVDLALLIDDQPVLYVEAKALKESTDEAKWITQTLNYAIADGVEWCVLTNGATYRIFRSHAVTDLEGKSFGTVKISDSNDEVSVQSIAASLSLLSPQSMKSKDLNALWGMREIDRQLDEGLKDIIERPEFHRWLSRSVFKDLNTKQIGQSLQRADFSISYPDIHKYINELEKNQKRRHDVDSAKAYQPTITVPKDQHFAKSHSTSNAVHDDLPKKSTSTTDTYRKKAKKMRTTEMVERKLLPIGTILTIKNRPGSEATVIDGKKVRYNSIDMSFHEWGKTVLGRAESIYKFAILPDKRTLEDLRQEAGMKDKDDQSISFDTSAKSKTKIHKEKKRVQKPRKSKTKKMLTTEMVNTGLLKEGTLLSIKGQPEIVAQVFDGKGVIYKNEIMSFHQWGRLVLGGSRNIYLYATIPDGRTLDELRRSK